MTKRTYATLIAGGVLFVFAITSIQADPPTQYATPIGKAEGSLMRSKLQTSQQVLEGLLRKDFRSIARGAERLKQISEAAEWPRSKDGVYTHFGAAFRRQCEQLERAAKNQDHEGVMFTYLGLTTSCVNCHDYVRDSRHAARPKEGDVRLIPSHWPARVSSPAH